MNRKEFIIFLTLVGTVIPVEMVAGSPPDTTLRNVRIRGVSQLQAEDVMRMIGLKEDAPLPVGWPGQMLDSLVTVYHLLGYFTMHIDSVRTLPVLGKRCVDVTIWIDEGKLFRVGKLTILNENEEIITGLPRGLVSRTGQIFAPENIEADIETILTWLENRGYPLSVVEIRSIELREPQEKPTLDVIIVVKKGPRVFLDRVDVTGNLTTRDRVITRELRLKPGDAYDHQRILRVKDRLLRMGTFRRVDEPRVQFSGNRAHVTLGVEDGNSNTLDGVIGYNPSTEEGGRGTITGRLHLSFRNLLGTGRFLEAYWQKKDNLSQAMRFGFEEPWILGWPIHIGARFHQELRDSTYIEREWNVSLRYTPWPTLSVYIEGGQRQILPDSLGSRRMGVSRTRAVTLSGVIDYNTLDDAWNPRKGIRYRTTFRVGQKENLGPDYLVSQEGWKPKVFTRKLEAHAEICLNPFPSQVVYLGLHGVEVRTGDRFVPLSDQIRFGGATTLRGYREDVFRGNLIAWSNLEYRLLVGRESRVFLFLDNGWFQRQEPDERIQGARVGYGFGIRLQTKVGLFGIDFGLGEGDRLMDAKVHVGLVNRF